jgi:DNA-binding response OmpR family regulator
MAPDGEPSQSSTGSEVCDPGAASARIAAKDGPHSVRAQPRLLIVEDEPKTRVAIAEAIKLEGWVATQAASGAEMLPLLEKQPFDLVLLDRMLPGRDGLELLQEVRGRGAYLPVIMLTARDAINERVMGLESGADDYIVKPFALAELIARCRAMLRRPVAPPGDIARCGDLEVNLRTRTAHRRGEAIPLTPREVDVLEYLLRYRGQVVSREMLERDVWRQTHRFTSLDNVIEVLMMRLRRKIDVSGTPPLIHTIRGVGYRLGPEPM